MGRDKQVGLIKNSYLYAKKPDVLQMKYKDNLYVTKSSEKNGTLVKPVLIYRVVKIIILRGVSVCCEPLSQ